jgi:hypothetical protein
MKFDKLTEKIVLRFALTAILLSVGTAFAKDQRQPRPFG